MYSNGLGDFWSSARDHVRNVTSNALDPGHYFTRPPGVRDAAEAGQAALDQTIVSYEAEIAELRHTAAEIVSKSASSAAPYRVLAIGGGIALLALPLIVRRLKRSARK